MSDGDLSEAELERNRNAGRTHGLYAFRDRGPDALEPGKVSRLQELREMVRTQPGREDIRREATARVVLITEMAFAEMRAARENDESIFDVPAEKRASTWFAELRRYLESWPPDEKEAANVLESLKNGD